MSFTRQDTGVYVESERFTYPGAEVIGLAEEMGYVPTEHDPDDAVTYLQTVSDDDVTWTWDGEELELVETEEHLADKWDVEPEAVRAFAEHYGAWDFTEDQFRDAYQGEAYSEGDDALKSWYFNTYLEDLGELDDLLTRARELAIMIDYRDVDLIAVKQDFANESGYVFRTYY